MRLTSKEREEKLRSLNLPEGILKIALNDEVPELLKDDCRKLNYYYDENIINVPEPDFLPLWEGHGSMTGVLNRKYVKFIIEGPLEVKVLGKSIHAVIADLLIWLWREEEIEDQLLIELANKLEFPCINRLLNEVEIANDKNYEDRSKWEESFRRSL